MTVITARTHTRKETRWRRLGSGWGSKSVVAEHTMWPGHHRSRVLDATCHPAPSREEQPLGPPGREASAAGGVSGVKPERPGPRGTSRSPHPQPQGKGGNCVSQKGEVTCPDPSGGRRAGPRQPSDPRAVTMAALARSGPGEASPPSTARHPRDRHLEICAQAGAADSF